MRSSFVVSCSVSSSYVFEAACHRISKRQPKNRYSSYANLFAISILQSSVFFDFLSVLGNLLFAAVACASRNSVLRELSVSIDEEKEKFVAI